TRQSFAALFVIVDSRRGVGEMDLGLLAWASRPADSTHVLLSKSDKLSRAEAQQTLRNANELLKGKASCQIFSAHDGQGLDEARAVLLRFMRSAKK
ncbi:MAG TPA: hypothetical protein VN645_15985, partial [Steroidobacteraceae bacterium]|nr:hypothetical protein [Steroidobacteraceae bacterium]